MTDKIPSKQEVLKKVWAALNNKRQLQIKLLVVLMIFVSFAEILSIGSVIPFLTALTAPEYLLNIKLVLSILSFFDFKTEREILFFYTVIFIFASLLAGSMRLLLVYFQTKLGAAIGADLCADMYKKALNQAFIEHLSTNSSKMIASISLKADSVLWYFINPLMTIASSILISLSIITTLILINPLAMIITIIFICLLYSLVILLTRKYISKNSQTISNNQSVTLKLLQEGFGGIKHIILHDLQNHFIEIFNRANKSLRTSQANNIIVASSPKYILETFGMILIASLAFIMFQTSNNSISIVASLGALAIGAQKLLPVIQLSYSQWIAMEGNMISVLDAVTILSKKEKKNLNSKIKAMPFNKQISLNNISLKYANHNKDILQNINMNFPKGSRIGIVGRSGSGKSSLANIIMGLVAPSAGTITVDSKLLNISNTRQWQKNLAHVPQEIFLSDDSLINNIAFGIPYNEINTKLVNNCIKKVLLETLSSSIEKSPRKFVGERGEKISGGEKQRIGIARALYRKPKCIIFDEATSSLDNQTEKEIIKNINSIDSSVTVIIIAHRISTLKECSHIYELKNGKIYRSGSFKKMFS